MYEDDNRYAVPDAHQSIHTVGGEMKRYNFEAGMAPSPSGYYILFTDHEAAIKKAVEDEREAIVQYLIDQGTIEVSHRAGRVYFITDEDIAAIRSRGEKP